MLARGEVGSAQKPRDSYVKRVLEKEERESLPVKGLWFENGLKLTENMKCSL